MKQPLFSVVIIGLALSACRTTPVPEYSGRWRPINGFAAQPEAIALSPAYVYYAMPADGTLKSLLERWAHDTSQKLAYQINMDYTLHAPVAQVRTTNLPSALAQLNQAYAAQGIMLTLEKDVITVRPAAGSASEPAAAPAAAN